MSIYKKLLEVKKQVPYLKKDKKSFQYSYATPSLVLGVFNPLLNEVGILLKTEVVSMTNDRIFIKTKEDKTKSTEKEKAFLDVYETLYTLNLRFTWIDVETGEKDENLFSASGVNGDEKGVGSALTYAERYFFLKYFNVPTDDDDPDAFQMKHMTKEEKEQYNKKVRAENISIWIGNIKNINGITSVWNALTKEEQEEHKELLSDLKKELIKTELINK